MTKPNDEIRSVMNYEARNTGFVIHWSFVIQLPCSFAVGSRS
jgi:hypothetical protein